VKEKISRFSLMKGGSVSGRAVIPKRSRSRDFWGSVASGDCRILHSELFAAYDLKSYRRSQNGSGLRRVLRVLCDGYQCHVSGSVSDCGKSPA
jgi:hypothetical protein